MEIIFEITFTKPMKKSDLVIIASDVNNNTMICKIVDAWQAVNSAENYQESNSQTERTILKLNDFRDFRFDGGQPIVFVGKLTSETGERIPSAKILIKSDAPCPKDGILASGFTDKYGKFWIYTITKTWNESDNVIKVHAEFEGNEKFEASISDKKSIVIYPSHGERCVN